MNLLKNSLSFFLSLRTTLWSLGALLIMMFAGAFVMPGNKAFQALHTTPLFKWIIDQRPETIWWLWGIIGILAVVTLNTLFCSIDSIIKKRKVTQWLLLISPQIIHIGFLFILFAHLLSSIGAYQKATYGREGTLLQIPGSNNYLRIKNIYIKLDYYGYMSDWQVKVEYRKGNELLQEDIIRPNEPSLFKGLNVNVKNLSLYPKKMILLQMNREPGAVWALIGGILFMIGIVILIVLKIKVEK